MELKQFIMTLKGKIVMMRFITISKTFVELLKKKNIIKAFWLEIDLILLAICQSILV